MGNGEMRWRKRGGNEPGYNSDLCYRLYRMPVGILESLEATKDAHANQSLDLHPEGGNSDLLCCSIFTKVDIELKRTNKCIASLKESHI